MKIKYSLTLLLLSLMLLNLRAGSIELSSFTGKEENGFIQLSWQTRTEHDLKNLSLEKSSNAIDFTTVAVYHSDGTSIEEKNYGFIDEHPFKGINYYRLKQTDTWGNVRYFKIIAVNYTKQIELPVYPNPITNKEFMIRLSGSSETSLNISNSNGRTVFTQIFPSQDIMQIFNVQLPSLEAGTYLFTLYSKEAVITQRIFITD